jgi:hypothetical protein
VSPSLRGGDLGDETGLVDVYVNIRGRVGLRLTLGKGKKEGKNG